jgi:hypothetical protein
MKQKPNLPAHSDRANNENNVPTNDTVILKRYDKTGV